MSGSAPIIQIPSIDGIDFHNPEEANRYALLLCFATREAAQLIPTGNLSAVSSIRRAAKEWINQIESCIDTYPPSEALKTANSYDFIHRLAYNTPPLPGIIDRQVSRALDEAIKENSIKTQIRETTNQKRIDPYLLYRLIEAGINRKDPRYFGRPLKWQSLRLTRWYREMKESLSPDNSKSPDLSDNTNLSNRSYNSNFSDKDKIEKLSIILSSDLTAFEGRNQKAFKRNLLQKHHQLLSLIPANLSKRIEILLSLRHLLFVSSPYIPEEEYEQKKTAITTAIRASISRHSCEARVAGASELPQKKLTENERVAGASELPQKIITENERVAGASELPQKSKCEAICLP